MAPQQKKINLSRLRFDRFLALGMRLDILSGTATRFEPGETRRVRLVEIAGRKVMRGGNALFSGALYTSTDGKGRQRALSRGQVAARCTELAFAHAEEVLGEDDVSPGLAPCFVPRLR